MDDLVKIKKYYGEKMMHLCRKLFPTILETDGLLFSLLEKNFYYSKFLYDDIINNNMIDNFKDYMYSLLEDKEIPVLEKRTPFELMDSVFYNLYECRTEGDIQKFKKYYAKGEELCTFDGGRLNSCYVFFAIKKNVDEIKRGSFKSPSRQDEYGTSVISIQFSRGCTNTLSIKNRYNHTVYNPDATFSNNLENIVPGLTKSFEDMYGLNINQNNHTGFELPGYVKANDGKFYKYNYEINNIYYGPDNIVIKDFEVDLKYLEKEKYLVFDYFILDLVNKRIVTLYNKENFEDCFVDEFKDIDKIEIKRIGLEKLITITYNETNKAFIRLNKYNEIISYKNEFVEEIGDYFLSKNKRLREINLPNVRKIGDDFLSENRGLWTLSLPNVIKIGNWFLDENIYLSDISLPKVMKIGDDFLCNNKNLKKIEFPNLIVIGNSFITWNQKIKIVYLPNVEEIGNSFLLGNYDLESIDLPKVISIGVSFLDYNKVLKSVSLPKVVRVGYDFLCENRLLKSLSLPSITTISDRFLWVNQCLKEIDLPNVMVIGDNFLANNVELEKIDFPNLLEVGDNFLEYNERIIDVNLPKINNPSLEFKFGIMKVKKKVRSWIKF